MEQNLPENLPVKQGVFKPALNAGIITGAGLIVLSLLIYLLGLSEVTQLSYIGYVILLAGIIWGTRQFRQEQCGGYISYGKALGFGTLTAFFASVLAGLFTLVFYLYIAPDALEQLRDLAEVRMLEQVPDATDQQMEFARMMVNPVLMFVGSLFTYTFVGFIFSLVTSAVLKKNEPMEP